MKMNFWIFPDKSWHILGDRLIPEQLLWIDRGILDVGSMWAPLKV